MKKLSIDTYRTQYSDPGMVTEEGFSLYETGPEDCHLPKRNSHTHKYSYGRALIIGGSVGFSGAPVLAANACERSGAGLTQLVVPDSIYAVAASRCDGAVVIPAQSDESGAFSVKALDTVLPLLTRADACVIGPGIGIGEGTGKLITDTNHQ